MRRVWLVLDDNNTSELSRRALGAPKLFQKPTAFAQLQRFYLEDCLGCARRCRRSVILAIGMNSPWNAAARLAKKTPEKRNRCVDFLRAVSILVVVTGHWLMAAPWVDADGAHISHLLDVSPWAQWLTWVMQVMPIFFFVGGYSNGISWDAACRDSTSYRNWLSSRLTRLLGPVLVLVLFWIVAASVAHGAGVSAGMIRVASQIALVPTWFLAVYALVVLLVPLTRSAWKSMGMWSIAIPFILAGLVDGAYFGFGWTEAGWVNYLFVWVGVHQLGYAWLEGRFASRLRSSLWCLIGLGSLVALTEVGPWPHSLVGVPGEVVSNTEPPHLPLVALAAFQFGSVMLIEHRLTRLLARAHLWTATVLINGMIMTIFLWHSTVMMLSFGASIWLGGIGLAVIPGTGDWWLRRLAWVAVFVLSLFPFIAIFSRFERPSEIKAPSPAPWRMAVGSGLMVVGLALLASGGIGGTGPLGLRLVPILLTLGGAEVAGVGVAGSLGAPMRASGR